MTRKHSFVRSNSRMMTQWGAESKWALWDYLSLCWTVKRFVDRNDVDLLASFFFRDDTPRRKHLFPMDKPRWRRGISKDLSTEGGASSSTLSLLLSSEFYLIVRRELVGRLKTRLVCCARKRNIGAKKRRKCKMIYCFSRRTLGI